MIILALALLLAGCGQQADKHPEWDENWTRFEELLAVETPVGWILAEYNPTLSMGGIWYATWANGAERMITNAEGEEAAVYDAQIFLVLKECGSEAEAKANVDDWIRREAQSYETGDSSEIEVAGQSFSCRRLLSSLSDNPYSFGASAFAARGELAVSAEILCAEGFDGDPQSILERFLSGVHYGE